MRFIWRFLCGKVKLFTSFICLPIPWYLVKNHLVFSRFHFIWALDFSRQYTPNTIQKKTEKTGTKPKQRIQCKIDIRSNGNVAKFQFIVCGVVNSYRRFGFFPFSTFFRSDSLFYLPFSVFFCSHVHFLDVLLEMPIDIWAV